MANNYTAPITLGFTPANGDRIGGTVNGVEVDGEWTGTGKTGGVVLKRVDDPDTTIYFVGFIDGRTVIVVQSDSAPTTDYELHLYRYVPADIVQIPQEYVEGLEAAAADATAAKTAAETAQSTANAAKTTAETAQSTANAAKTTAETAQSTANAAKTTAETAQSTANTAKTAAETAQSTANTAKTAANSIKPDWNETSTTSPKYIANRPCYYVRTETRISKNIPDSPVLIEDTQLYWHGTFASQNNAALVDSGEKYRFANGTEVFKCTSYRTDGYVYYDIIGNASLVVDHIGIVADGYGNPVPNTGEDWAYVTVRSSLSSSMYAKTKNYQNGVGIYKVTETIKKLDPILLPDEAVLPTVTASDSGKFLRVSESGAWEAEEGIILNSSTAGSTKKFKITVDDAGVISATEVTT